MSYELLDKINSVSDVKTLSDGDVTRLCSEIREFLVESTNSCGGHLASNLGAVEMTLAIHSVFDSPKDHIIFDVGHQCYTHKILTGRSKDFVKLRKKDGNYEVCIKFSGKRIRVGDSGGLRIDQFWQCSDQGCRNRRQPR